jgi:hypothetical protein
MFFVFKLDVLGLCHIEGKNALCVNIFWSNISLLNFHCVGDVMKGRWI